MVITFDVGVQEKHRIEFRWDQLAGTSKIIVDDEVVAQPRAVVFGELKALASRNDVLRQILIERRLPNRPPRCWGLDVGNKEIHSIRIEKHSPKLLPGLRMATFLVFVDGVLVQTQTGNRTEIVLANDPQSGLKPAILSPKPEYIGKPMALTISIKMLLVLLGFAFGLPALSAILGVLGIWSLHRSETGNTGALVFICMLQLVTFLEVIYFVSRPQGWSAIGLSKAVWNATVWSSYGVGILLGMYVQSTLPKF